MDSAILVKDQREDALAMIDSLRQAGYPMTAAFWLYLPDANRWRLYIATPLLNRDGPLAAYKRLQTEINRLPQQPDDLSVSNITLISPRSKQVARLQEAADLYGRNDARIRHIEMSDADAYMYYL